jgi:hypothetical protein
VPRHPTTEQLRHAIDRGRTAEKVDFPDPAAAPLGTDSEAGGDPPSKDRVAAAMDNEVRRRSTPRSSSGPLIFVSILASIIAIAIALVLYAR